MIPARNMIDNMMIIAQFIGILISGSLLFLVFPLAFRAMSRIMIPVIPPEITPPIPRIDAKLRNPN